MTMIARQEGVLVREYLAQLGLDEVEVSSDGLRLVHRAHVQRFAHDTVWMSRGRVPELDQVAMARALLAGEGGGCLQLNAGLAWLLEQLGFVVRMHRTRVQRAFESEPTSRPDAHLVLTVDLDDGPWLADVGLGTGMLEAVPLVEGPFEQEGGFRYALTRSLSPGYAWQFHHDRRLIVLRMTEWEAAAATLADFAGAYEYDTQHTDSIFLRHITASRRRRDGVATLTGATLINRSHGARSVRHLESAVEWEQVLREEFGLGLPGWTSRERDRLWTKVLR